MTETMMHYPDDPPERVRLLTREEFLQLYPPATRDVRVSSFDGAPVEVFPLGDLVVCDHCNAEVQPQENCALAMNRLYCNSCSQEWILPYVLTGGTQ